MILRAFWERFLGFLIGKRFILIEMDDDRKKRKCMRIFLDLSFKATPLIPFPIPANAFSIKSDFS